MNDIIFDCIVLIFIRKVIYFNYFIENPVENVTAKIEIEFSKTALSWCYERCMAEPVSEGCRDHH